MTGTPVSKAPPRASIRHIAWCWLGGMLALVAVVFNRLAARRRYPVYW